MIFIARMMKIRLVLPILIILLVSSASLAAEFNSLVTFTKSWKDKDRTDFLEGRLPISVLDYLDKIYEKSPHQYLIYELGTKLYVQVACTFDLYEVSGDKLVKKIRLF